jgi:hypothetical protein
MRDFDSDFDEWAKSRVEAPPPVLYHYTKWEGFEGIVRSQRVWAFDFRSMRDMRELAWEDEAVEEVGRRLSRELTGKPLKALKGFRKLYPRYRLSQLRDRIFLACFSAARDDPRSQWDEFAGGGRGLCLGISVLDESRERIPGISLGLKSVQYDADGVLDVMDTGFRRVLQGFQPGEDVESMCAQLFRYVGLEAVRCKGKSYSKEREWRLIAWIREENAGSVGIQKLAGRGDYVPLQLRDDGKLIALDEVILGPNQEHADAAERARRVLLATGYAGARLPKITRSGFTSRE